jgi:hypothetical protein
MKRVAPSCRASASTTPVTSCGRNAPQKPATLERRKDVPQVPCVGRKGALPGCVTQLPRLATGPRGVKWARPRAPDRGRTGKSAGGIRIRTRRSPARKSCFVVHRGCSCTPHMAGSGDGFTMRGTVSCASAGAGRTGLPWGRRQRQADGSAAGGHPHFFWNTFPAAAPGSPPFGFARCAIRRTVPSREPPRKRPGLLAGPGFARSRIGCSWRPAPVRRQDVGAGLGTRMAEQVSPEKKFSWPPAALPSLCRFRRVHARVERPPPAAVP